MVRCSRYGADYDGYWYVNDNRRCMMKRFKNILLFADHHDRLGSALDRVMSLLKSNNARLTVMDVTPDSGLAEYIN